MALLRQCPRCLHVWDPTKDAIADDDASALLGNVCLLGFAVGLVLGLVLGLLM